MYTIGETRKVCIFLYYLVTFFSYIVGKLSSEKIRDEYIEKILSHKNNKYFLFKRLKELISEIKNQKISFIFEVVIAILITVLIHRWLFWK